MDSQPDFKRLSGVFATVSTEFETASQEIAVIANLTTFSDGQHLFKAMNGLTKTVRTLGTDIDNIDAKFTALDTRFTTFEAAIGGRFDILEVGRVQS